MPYRDPSAHLGDFPIRAGIVRRSARGDQGGGSQLVVVHVPGRDLAAGTAPKYVGEAIAVEVAGSRHAPVTAGIDGVGRPMATLCKVLACPPS